MSQTPDEVGEAGVESFPASDAPAWTLGVAADEDDGTSETGTPAVENSPANLRERGPQWAVEVSRVVYALAVHWVRLRRAARRAGDPRLSQRLRRLALRRRADARELGRSVPRRRRRALDTSDVGRRFSSQIAIANEIGSLAASLRSNRKVRLAIEGALAAHPPPRVTTKLQRLRDDIDKEAGTINARLRAVAIVDA